MNTLRDDGHVEVENEETRKALEATNRGARNTISNIRDYNSQRDFDTRKTGDESVRSISSAADFGTHLLSSNTSLSDAQKIAEEYRIGSQAADAIYQAELKTASLLSTEKDRNEATDKARLDNELALQKVKEDGIEKIAALEAEKVNEFRSTVGGLFDAISSRQPRAVPDFIKSQGLGLARTITENAAQQYILPSLQKLTPSFSGPLGSLLKGTPFESDPLHKSATALDGSAASLTAAAHALSAAAGGGRVSSNGTISSSGSGSGSIASLGTDAYGNAIPDISSGGDMTSALGGLSANLPTGVTSTGMLAKTLNGFGTGATSVLSGNALSTLLGYGTPGVNGQPGTDPTTAQRVGAGVGLAANTATNGLAAFQDFKKGGAKGTADGIADIAMTIAPFTGPAAPFIEAGAAAVKLITSLLGDNSVKRANAINSELSANQYQAPTALNVTQGSNGGFTDFGVRGNIRTSDLSPYPQTTNPYLWEQTHGLFGGPPTYYQVPDGQTSQFGGGAAPAPTVQHIYQAGAISTIDSTGFQALAERNGPALGNVVASQMANSHARLTAEVQRAANA